MIPMSADAKIWLAAVVTDMRRGFNGLAAQTQQVLAGDPCSGHLFFFVACFIIPVANLAITKSSCIT